MQEHFCQYLIYSTKSHQAFVTSIITTMTKIVGKEKSNYLDYGIF